MPKYSNGRLRVGSMECEKMKKALALALVISMTMVGTMFAQATPGSGNGNGADSSLAPGQQPLNPGHDGIDGKEGAPGQTGINPGIGNEPKGVGE